MKKRNVWQRSRNKKRRLLRQLELKKNNVKKSNVKKPRKNNRKYKQPKTKPRTMSLMKQKPIINNKNKIKILLGKRKEKVAKIAIKTVVKKKYLN